MFRHIRYVTVLGLLLCAALATAQQSTAVDWSAFDQGFQDATSGTTSARSVAGQSFIGLTLAGNSQIISGFLANKRLRGPFVGVNVVETIPQTYALLQNFPNPFNPTTKIQFTIVNRLLTIVKVYDVLGREVTTLVNEVKEPGTYTVQFDGSSLASGVYLYRMQSGDFVQTRKSMIIK